MEVARTPLAMGVMRRVRLTYFEIVLKCARRNRPGADISILCLRKRGGADYLDIALKCSRRKRGGADASISRSRADIEEHTDFVHRLRPLPELCQGASSTVYFQRQTTLRPALAAYSKGGLAPDGIGPSQGCQELWQHVFSTRAKGGLSVGFGDA